jgi:hypothetical protein
MAFKIPVFVSAPTTLSKSQEQSYNLIISLLERENLERRALGRSDYPTEYPLKEVVLMARRCSGGIILGYSQFESKSGVFKPGTDTARTEHRVKFPTPWNQLEAGILFAMKLPLMVFREDGINGGVFDNGVTDVFINKLPTGEIGQDETSQLIAAIQTWVARVRNHYREWN